MIQAVIEIDGSEFPARHEQRFRAGTANCDQPDRRARTVDGILQVENNLAALDPKQMVSSAFGTAFDEADGEDIDMPRHDQQHVPAVIEKSRVTTVEHNAGRRTGGRLLIGRRGRPWEDRIVHS